MNPKHTRISFVLAAFAFLSATLQLGCGSGRGSEGAGLLPKAPEQPTLSKTEPEKPYSQLAPGILTRTLLETPGQPGYRIEVRDLLIGPGQRPTNISLPGAAVFEIRSGTGTFTSAGKSQEIRSGSAFVLQDGENFDIGNQSDVPIEIRVHLFIAI